MAAWEVNDEASIGARSPVIGAMAISRSAYRAMGGEVGAYAMRGPVAELPLGARPQDGVTLPG